MLPKQDWAQYFNKKIDVTSNDVLSTDNRNNSTEESNFNEENDDIDAQSSNNNNLEESEDSENKAQPEVDHV